MPRIVWIVLALGLALVGAPPVSAGTLAVDFDLESSFLRIGVGDRLILGNRTLGAPGLGSADVMGSARLTLTDVDSRGVATEPTSRARLSGLTLTFDTTFSSDIGGSIQITQTPDPSGAVVGVEFDPSDLLLPVTGGIGCLRPGSFSCMGPLFGPPNEIPFPLTIDAVFGGGPGVGEGDDDLPIVLRSESVGAPGSPLVFTAVLRAMQGAQPLELTLIGVETARTFVPEPAELGVLGIGLLAVGSAWHRRSARLARIR